MLDLLAENGSREALIGPDRSYTYAELDRLSGAASAAIESLGIKRGGRVALYLPNSAEYIVLLLALFRSGCIACPISTRLPLPAIPDLLRSIAAPFLITPDGHRASFPSDIQVISAKVLLQHPLPKNRSGNHLALDRPVTAVFTSGSTGTPKAALHTWGNHYYNALGSNRNILLQPGHRWLMSLPLYHVGGLGILFRCLTAGAVMVLPPPDEPLQQTIPRMGITHVSMVATQLMRALKAGGAGSLSTLEAVLLGGSAIPDALVEEAVEQGLPVHTSYGLTEMASQVTTTAPGAGLDERRTSGRVLPFRELRISDEGEILVRGKTLFAGYLNQKGIDRPIDMDGWFHTNDLGILDRDGCLTVRGRRDHMFISGGENIQPEEIERALCGLPGVVEAVVVPVPDETFGYRPVAFIRSDEIVLEVLAEQLSDALPRFKIPIAFFQLPGLEGSPGIKIDRFSLRQRAAEALGKK
jgi:o-succinylbenzoate---CoA ligase